jgi:hypothetical protein
MMIFYQQVTEGQLIKKEPINEEALGAKSSQKILQLKSGQPGKHAYRKKQKRATIQAARFTKL